MKIITWNINGIRAIQKKGFSQWLKEHSPDIICLQEIKASPDVIPQDYLNHPEFHSYHLSAQRKGYSGVMTLSKHEPIETIYGLKNFKDEGRTLIHVYTDFVLVNSYFPNGGREHERVDYKMKYCKAIATKVKALRKKYELPVFVCGDFNTAHKEADLKNFKTNKKTSGFLPLEREWMDRFYSQGMRDIFRELYPSTTDTYSWWSYRNDCRGRNIGWRIDYFWGSEDALAITKDCGYLYESIGSDHCPVFLEVK